MTVATNPKMPVLRRNLNSVMEFFPFDDHPQHKGISRDFIDSSPRNWHSGASSDTVGVIRV